MGEGLQMECNWSSIIGGPVGKAVAEAVSLVEGGSGPVSALGQDTFGLNGGDERCGVLHWWPTEWLVDRGAWVCELVAVELENAAMDSSAAFELTGEQGVSILSRVISRCEELRGDAGEMPNVFFGTWHTHPRGSVEVSAQDLVGEKMFDDWRGAVGGYPLGNPRSFLFAQTGSGVNCVVAYDVRGAIAKWTPTK